MDFKIKSVSKRQGHYIIKRSVQEKDTTIINIHVPKIGAPKYMRQLLMDIKGEINQYGSLIPHLEK